MFLKKLNFSFYILSYRRTFPDDDLVNRSKIWLFISILCYSWRFTLNFRAHRDAHFGLVFVLYLICLALKGFQNVDRRRSFRPRNERNIYKRWVFLRKASVSLWDQSTKHNLACLIEKRRTLKSTKNCLVFRPIMK